MQTGRPFTHKNEYKSFLKAHRTLVPIYLWGIRNAKTMLGALKLENWYRDLFHSHVHGCDFYCAGDGTQDLSHSVVCPRCRPHHQLYSKLHIQKVLPNPRHVYPQPWEHHWSSGFQSCLRTSVPSLLYSMLTFSLLIRAYRWVNGRRASPSFMSVVLSGLRGTVASQSDPDSDPQPCNSQ